MTSEKVYWIGDNKDEKAALIGKTFYLPGDVIPVDEVEKSRLENWKTKGLVSGGANSPPVVIKDTETVKHLEATIRDLKVKLDAMPALQEQVTELKGMLEKAKAGKKAARVKELEGLLEAAEKAATEKDAAIENLKKAAIRDASTFSDIELDNQEKAALIDKLNNDIENLTKPDDVVVSDDETGAGPGGES